jgi:hypothetical protein
MTFSPWTASTCCASPSPPACCRARLQEPQARRTGFPPPQGRRPRPAAGLPPPRRTRQSPRPDLHARSLPHLAHLAQGLGPLACTDENPPSPSDPGRPCRPVRLSPGQGLRQANQDGQPARSYHGLLAHLAAMPRNQVLNGAQHSHWFGVFGALNVPMGNLDKAAWSAAAPCRCLSGAVVTWGWAGNHRRDVLHLVRGVRPE